jgi:hypothetical protein
MSEHTAIYDLGDIRATASSAARRRGGAATVAQASALPGLAASASLFVPGLGHLLVREWQAALFFVSTIGCAAATAWSLWELLPVVLPTLRWLEVASWCVAVVFGVQYVAMAALHVFGVLDAHNARLRACLPRRAHPIVAVLASAVVPGWGQVLAGKRGRGAVFLSTLWILGAAWLLALPLTRQTLDRLGLRLPLDEGWIDRSAPIVLLVVTGVVWAVAVWDAAATRSARR